MEPVFSLKHIKIGKNKSNTAIPESSFPSTAYDYLKHVQDEAFNCPDVMVAPMDCSQFLVNQDCSFTTPDSLSQSQDSQPSLQWQQEQTAAFSGIRQFLVQQKALLGKEKKISLKLLPLEEDESEWFELCFGKQHARNVEGQLNEIEGTVDQEDKGTPALLSIICQMNQPTVLTVLDYHIDWLKTRPLSSSQGQWIYALLAAVEKPLLADTTYSLRSLARLCAKQKDSLTQIQNTEMAALHLIITMVTRYFGQSDLAETSKSQKRRRPSRGKSSRGKSSRARSSRARSSRGKT